MISKTSAHMGNCNYDNKIAIKKKQRKDFLDYSKKRKKEKKIIVTFQ
jgi:hypothetical protein